MRLELGKELRKSFPLPHRVMVEAVRQDAQQVELRIEAAAAAENRLQHLRESLDRVLLELDRAEHTTGRDKCRTQRQRIAEPGIDNAVVDLLANTTWPKSSA